MRSFPNRLSTRRLFLTVAIGSAVVSALVSLRAAQTEPEVFQRTLTFEERVENQRKIEEVYWRHRIWPKERTDPKPELRAVMSRDQIETKVRDHLRSSRMLEDYWQRPVSSAQVQAEMDRIAQETKDPEMLRELFEALGNDPFVIAECLVRPALSERRANEFYGTSPKPANQRRAAGGSDAVFTGYSLPVLTSNAGVCTDNTWSPLIDVPAHRSGHTMVWTGSEMIVWGGGNYDRALATGDRYNPATDSWSTVSLTNAPTARSSHTAVWTGTEMIVWGGSGSNGLPVVSGGKYDPASDSWTPTSLSNVPTARYSHTAVWSGIVMLVWGGFEPGGAYPNTGGRYDPITDSWSALTTTNAPAGRTRYSAVWTGSEMIIWGGQISGSGSPMIGAKYNPASDTWMTMSAVNAPANRTSHSAVWTGAEMIIWGGENGSYLNDGARYDPAADTWVTLTASNPPPGRYSHSAVWTGSEMIVWGGIYNFTQPNAGGRFNPATNTWSPMTMNNAPSALAERPTIWTGSEMITFGGGYGDSNTGGRYNPTADIWTQVRSTNTPAGRYQHKTVWTGAEMIVWGGSNGFNSINTGGRYDPALDAWTPTSTVNAPDARELHTAVWTGMEMIVWGGWRSKPFNILNTGGRYNPATNSWTSTTLTNAPQARRWHSAVWSGSEMIVWGGEKVGGGNANTGGRYNPNTDSWIATSTTNAPSARKDHTAVWSGSEMIVFGGGYTPENTGGKYNPVTDTWVATSTDTAARSNHTAVWTGNEMIVWGGYNGAPLNTGARYNPSADTWTPTSLVSVPTGRSTHAVVWTGDEMIVWGGYNGSFLNSGGRYRPSTDAWTATSRIDAPHEAEYPTGVWTGSRMIVFGGFYSISTDNFLLNTGGALCSKFVRLANISTRAFVQTGDNVLFGGLIITGGGPKKVVLRALGPSLSNFGIADALLDPVLELHDSTGALLASNDNWMDATNKQAIIDSGLAPSHNFESVIFTSLNPGSYTAVIQGVNNMTGTAVIEAYDLDETASSKFGNISTRSFVKTGDNVMIGGVIARGSAPQDVLVRGIGPSLTQFGVPNALSDPLLELHDGNGGLVASNDNWIDASNKQAIIDSGLAPSDKLEAAILTALNPGSYTAIVRGVQNGTGVALVEVFGLN
ncbi:MAG TPA: kelch repeat-containing protein [Chthoniobacterales bacterium]|nr:kelch repeat-containing protein [Chthoniobacterales bacterium]